MKKKLDIFIFIDALGWEIVNKYKFLEDLLPYRYPVEMQFGYSATAIPTILTGQPPTSHKHLSFYYFDPEGSPFKIFKYLFFKYLPGKIVDRWRFRHIMSKIIAKLYGYTGYFELYSMPFKKLHYFNYCEKKDIFIPGGLDPVKNIADRLVEHKIPHHISNWRLSESENVGNLLEDIQKGEIEFAFLYTAAMDSLLHKVTKDGKEIPGKLEWYGNQINSIINEVKNKYENYSISIISDHGMTTTIDVINLIEMIDKLGFKFGKDYTAVYDSTMARFWFFNVLAREKITETLEKTSHAHILSNEEMKKYRIDFPDNMYGETFLLMDPGYQIEPCDMGRKALPAMHGFRPEDKDSYAAFLSTEPPSPIPLWVGDFFKIMLSKINGD